LVSLNLFAALRFAFLALFLLNGTNLFGCLELSMLTFFLNNVDRRSDTRSFGKLIFELFQLVAVLGVIQVNGGLEVLYL
jgi:hypothetical protein